MSKAFSFLMGCILAISISGPSLAGPKDNLCVQSELKALGYYSGEITGRIDAASKAAGDAYIAEMIAKYPGWAQARLSSAEAAMWCKQLAAAFPNELSQYLIASQDSAGLVHVSGIAVDGPTTTTQPYDVVFNFRAEGDVSITAVCFLWNGRNQVCVALPEGIRKGPIKIGLTTGRAGTYNLNGFVKYSSNGKSFLSAETSTQITVQ